MYTVSNLSRCLVCLIVLMAHTSGTLLFVTPPVSQTDLLGLVPHLSFIVSVICLSLHLISVIPLLITKTMAALIIY